MSLVRWNPFLTRWPSIWDDEDFAGLTGTNSAIDLYETEDEVVVEASVAGVPADQVDVTFEKNVLWIKAQAQQEQSADDKKYYSKSSRNYSYKIAVPGDIDPNAEPNAEVDHGVIKVRFRKAETAKPKKLAVKAKN
ncbi:MAG: hypothetical protein COU69_00570 [Candidatus Pacebacteria bacterium CG10_big_fil_rev_8_21_14_0_10_56_10]|nr:MAG: hypothetical protein COU69_00570 [Candidatus Pacebacteria bacterium CG10_big_fil_rev_8_21_14_0_10_56_10]